MKLNITFLLIIFIIKDIKYISNKRTKKKEDKDKDLDKLENKEEEEESSAMTEEEFEEKLKVILKERHLDNKKKKITKDIMREIFDQIYGNEFDMPEAPPEIVNEDGEKLDPDLKPDSKVLKNEIFDKATRSLDYDDEILVTDIKKWISPKNIKSAVNEIVSNLIGMMGDL
jgi:hypothetical protein